MLIMDTTNTVEVGVNKTSELISSGSSSKTTEVKESELNNSDTHVTVLSSETDEKVLLETTSKTELNIVENTEMNSVCENKCEILPVEKSSEDTIKTDDEEKDKEHQEDNASVKQLRHSLKAENKILLPVDSKVKNKEETQQDTLKDVKERKRRYRSMSGTPVNKPLIDENIVKNKRRRFQQVSDKFCWRCNKDSVEAHCSACPRSWHRKCIGGTPPESMENWICGECAAILKAENAETRSEIMAHVTVDQLCMMLKHVVERMRDYPGSEPFWKPVDISEVTNYLDYVVKPMDLGLLESNVRAKLYGSTDAFMADAKWIQHNCIVFNTCGGVYTDTLKLTNAAKKIIKVARQEVSEMEACPDCYAHGRNLPRPMPSWFIEPCRKPHVLVWAKVKGFPFWPAKALPRQNSQGFVDVRFFGQHDRAWVSPKDMYLYSKEPPTSFPRKRKQDMDDCVKEIDRHCQKLAMVFGEFVFAPNKVLYNPQDPLQIKLLLPQYDTSQPSSSFVKMQSSTTTAKKRSVLSRRSTPVKRKSVDECTTDSNNSPSVVGESKKNRLSSSESHIKGDGDQKRQKSQSAVVPFKEIENTTIKANSLLTDKKDTPNITNKTPMNKKNGLFGQKSSTSVNETKINHQVKKLSAILPSRISKRPSSNNKNVSGNKFKLKDIIKKTDSPEAERKRDSNNKQLNSSDITLTNRRNTSTLNKPATPVAANKNDSLLLRNQEQAPNAMTNQEAGKNVIHPSKISASNHDEQQPLTFFVLVNNDAVDSEKKLLYLKSSGRTTVTNVTTATSTSMTTMVAGVNTTTTANTVTTSPVIKQEPRAVQQRSSQTPSPTPIRKESKAKKTFSNKTPRFPQQQKSSANSSFPRNPMVYIPNYMNDDRSSSYELPPPEAGPLSDRLNKGAQELAKRMAQLMEETLNHVAQSNNLNTQENSTDCYRAVIHSLQLKIERLKWQHQQQIAELEHNNDRKVQEMRASLEAEQQRLLEDAQKSAEEKRLQSIEETKRKQWCAMCGREANYYCCWNTAYCDYPCQQVHWSAHMDKCRQKPVYRTVTATNSQLLMPKLAGSS